MPCPQKHACTESAVLNELMHTLHGELHSKHLTPLPPLELKYK